MSKRRMYRVTHKKTKEVRLVRASVRTRVLMHVARSEVDIDVPTGDEVALHMLAGVKPEDVDDAEFDQAEGRDAAGEKKGGDQCSS